jgi:hypothetical protein
MERRDHEDTIADATGMERPDDAPAMPAAKDLDDAHEASGDEHTAIEGMSGIAATHRAFGGGSVGRAGGIGTHVPADEDDHPRDTEPGDADASTDPRGY